MRISKDRFSELISLYLDDEASLDELKLLAHCINNNSQMRAMFVRACKIHAATCKMYGKPVKLRKIYGLDFALNSGIERGAMHFFLEWSAVGVLGILFVSVATIVTFNSLSEKQSDSGSVIKSNPKYAYMIVEFDKPTDTRKNNEIFSVLTITQFHPALQDPNRK